jgi:hypothetical protein
MSSHVGHRRRTFSADKRAVAEELRRELSEVSWMLTFSLSKVSPGACSTYRMQYCVLLYFSMHLLIVHYILDSWMMVTGCMVVPLPFIILVVDVFTSM